MGKFYHIEPRLRSMNSEKLETPILFFMFEEPHAPVKKFDLHTHEFVEIFYITGGKGMMYHNDKASVLLPGDIFVINKGVPHVEFSTEQEERLTFFTLTIDESFPFAPATTEDFGVLHFSVLDRPLIKNAIERIHD